MERGGTKKEKPRGRMEVVVEPLWFDHAESFWSEELMHSPLCYTHIMVS